MLDKTYLKNLVEENPVEAAQLCGEMLFELSDQYFHQICKTNGRLLLIQSQVCDRIKFLFENTGYEANDHRVFHDTVNYGSETGKDIWIEDKTVHRSFGGIRISLECQDNDIHIVQTEEGAWYFRENGQILEPVLSWLDPRMTRLAFRLLEWTTNMLGFLSYRKK